MALFSRRYRLFFLGAAAAWGGILAFLALQPSELVLKILPHRALHSLAHLAFYAVFAWLVCIWLWVQRQEGRRGRFLDYKIALLALAAVAFWGGATELLQLLRPDRYTQWKDWFWNMGGGLSGVSLFLLKTRVSGAWRKFSKR